ncbi:MAG: radical SAM protein [Deltaproteobacteria bacterium]|nr:radical SAM protein [Deltaproteobacteria bacterium]
MRKQSLKLALVGPDQQENLALAYLASAAEAAGHAATLVRFNGRADTDACCDALNRLAPDVVGVGIAFQYAIDDSLGLVAALRRRGFRGHVTCGGHVPTFCYRELLAEAPGIDTAVRHEGEETLVELLGLLAEGRPVRGIAGLVWREGEAAVAGPARPLPADLDRLEPPKRPALPMTVGGVPIAFLITARGCVGECNYCSIRAFGRDAGGAPLRLRDPEAVADEAFALYRDKRVRVLFVQDDLFILPSEGKTVDRVERLGRAMRDRGMGRAAFWVKGRPESITPRVLEAIREMGAIHVFLGVENASAARLEYLGRTHRPEDNARAIALCREHGVRPSFNLMMFDPDAALGDVATTIDFASANVDLPWNACRTEIYSGTRLLKRLRAEGRLEGDYRSYGYTMRDLNAEIMFRIMRVSFHERAFAFDGLLNRLISLSFARQVHERFFPGPITQVFSRDVDALIAEVHCDTVDEMRRTLDFASRADPSDSEGVRAFAVEAALAMNARALPWNERFERLWGRLSSRGAALFAAQGGGRERAC